MKRKLRMYAKCVLVTVLVCLQTPMPSAYCLAPRGFPSPLDRITIEINFRIRKILEVWRKGGDDVALLKADIAAQESLQKEGLRTGTVLIPHYHIEAVGKNDSLGSLSLVIKKPSGEFEHLYIVLFPSNMDEIRLPGYCNLGKVRPEELKEQGFLLLDWKRYSRIEHKPPPMGLTSIGYPSHIEDENFDETFRSRWQQVLQEQSQRQSEAQNRVAAFSPPSSEDKISCGPFSLLFQSFVDVEPLLAAPGRVQAYDLERQDSDFMPVDHSRETVKEVLIRSHRWRFLTTKDPRLDCHTLFVSQVWRPQVLLAEDILDFLVFQNHTGIKGLFNSLDAGALANRFHLETWLEEEDFIDNLSETPLGKVGKVEIGILDHPEANLVFHGGLSGSDLAYAVGLFVEQLRIHHIPHNVLFLRDKVVGEKIVVFPRNPHFHADRSQEFGHGLVLPAIAGVEQLGYISCHSRKREDLSNITPESIGKLFRTSELQSDTFVSLVRDLFGSPIADNLRTSLAGSRSLVPPVAESPELEKYLREHSSMAEAFGRTFISAHLADLLEWENIIQDQDGGGTWDVFWDGLPKMARDKRFGVDWIDKRWSDLFELGKLVGRGAGELFRVAEGAGDSIGRRGSFDELEHTFGMEWLNLHWQELIMRGKELGSSAPHYYRDALPAVKHILTPTNFSSIAKLLADLGKKTDYNAWTFFQTGISGLQDILTAENLQTIGQDLVYMGNAAQGNAAKVFFQLKLLKERRGNAWLIGHWRGVVELSIGAGVAAGHFFVKGLTALEHAFGIPWVDDHWEDLVEMGKAAGERSEELFAKGIPGLQEHFGLSWVNQHWHGLKLLCKAAGVGSADLFVRVIPNLKKQYGAPWFLQHWEKLRLRLIDLLKYTTDYNCQRILETVFHPENLAWLARHQSPVQGQHADLLFRHLEFYAEVVSKEKRLANQVLEGIIEGLKKGFVDPELPKAERKLILDCTEKLHNFSSVLFAIYKKEGDRGLEPLFEFSRKILKDAVGKVDIWALSAAYTVMGLDGQEILASAIQIAIPASGASFVKRNEVRELLEKYIQIGDLRSHVPDGLKDRDFGEGSKDVLYVSEWQLRAGMFFDPDKKIAKLLKDLRYHDAEISGDEKDKRIQRDKEKLMNALKRYFAGEERKEAVLGAFYAYASHNDQLGEKVDRIMPDEYAGLNTLEQLFLDKDNLSVLLEKILEEFFKTHPGLIPQTPAVGVEQVIGPDSFLKKLEGIWRSKVDDQEKQKRLTAMLHAIDPLEIQTKILPKLSNDALKAMIVKTQQSLRPMKPLEIIEDFFRIPHELIQAEKEKFEEISGVKECVLEFRVVKGMPYGLWGLNAGVCIAPDTELWKDPHFMLLAMIDRNSGKTVGFMHLFETEVNGEKVLTVPGLEPSVEFLSEISAKEVYPLIEKALIKIAEKGAYEALYFPTTEKILSNRPDMVSEVRKRHAGKTVIIDPQVQWNHIPQPFPFSEVYEIWRRPKPAVAVVPQDNLSQEEFVSTCP